MSRRVDALLREVVVLTESVAPHNPYLASTLSLADSVRREAAEQRKHLKSDPRRIYVCVGCGDLTQIRSREVDASIDYPTPYPAGPSMLRHKAFDIEVLSKCCGADVNVYVLDEDFDPKEVCGEN